MDAQQFLVEFGHIANAPEGVNRLRELVFSLASEGKLLADCEPIDTTHLDKIADFVMGQAPPGNECNKRGDGTVFVKTGEFGELYPVVREWTSKPLKLAKRGDVLICVVGATVGKLNLAIDCAIGRSVAAIRPRAGLITKYLYFMLMPFTLRLRRDSRGSAQGVIGKAELAAVKLRVPSEDEQSRIVAKVDELMALCDKLEAQQQVYRKLQNALRQSTLQAVASSQSPHELQTTWARLADNFGRLFHAPEDVGQLRDLILDLAVHGLLVDQSDADEPIADWLANVTATKTALVKQKLIPKQTAMAELADDDYPFSLPSGWTFVRLGQITSKIGSGSTPRGGRAVYVKEGVPFLRSQNVWNDGLRLDDVACITPEEHKRMSGTAVLGNDVLLNITGASLGRCALVPSKFGKANVSQHVTIIRLTDPQVREYLHLCILSPYTQSMIWGRQVGMAREGLSKKVLEQFEIPLPPIAEQHRIVARVAELMRFCDVMEQQLKRSLQIAEKLAVASVASITGIAIEQEEESMKAPQTELIAPLRLGTTPDIKAQAPLATILARHNGEMSAKDLWQRFGGEVDAFYTQLKTEVAHGWIMEPVPAEMREKAADTSNLGSGLTFQHFLLFSLMLEC